MKPIIDIHAHIFNARDIPLKGYLLSRKHKTLMERWLGPILIPSVAKCIRRQLSPENLRCKLALEVVYGMMGKQYRKWADTLSKPVIDIASEMVDTFQKDGIDVYIPLIIDYEYWFKNTPDTPIKDQIEYIYDQIVLAYRGRIHPFAPFDPARELAFRKGMDNPDGKPEQHGSLKLVKDAIETKGFIGVKLYNALGYRPFNNETVDDKRRRIPHHRYKDKKYHVFKGVEYDEVLSDLYDYCVDNEVPITAHCVMDGIESYPKASWDFGNAVFWRDVLGQERYRTLHLNLAHFGWDQHQGYHGKKSWVKDICAMFAEYDYLFADVSHHRVMLDTYSPRFKSDYKDLCRVCPVAKKRVLFGIDWHVIKRVRDFDMFKDRYIDVLKHEDLFTDGEIDDFLGGNALNFLGLMPGGKNRGRLGQFYQDHEIDPPEWFTSTSV